MKFFVRGLGEKNPRVLAFYPDDSPVRDNAHGEGVSILHLPKSVLTKEKITGLPILVEDWRERVGTLPVEAEAKRRIDEVFASEDQIIALRETLDDVLKYGSDVSKWPEEARLRKAEADVRWNYVSEIRERVRAAPVVPHDPASDKIWPTRIAKRK